MRKPRRISLATVSSVAMLGLGPSALAASIVYTSTILAFIGLGLTFWGAVLLYIRNKRYVEPLLDASAMPFPLTIDQALRELDYNGDPVYLPPKYFQDPETTKIYISKQKSATLPTPEQIQKYEKQLFLRTPQGMLLTPPGAELATLMEKTIEESFTRLDLQYLQQNLPRILIEDLEIAENIEIKTAQERTAENADSSANPSQTESSMIHVKMTSPVYDETRQQILGLTNTLRGIGCPLSSAIACALAKATGQPITIEKQDTSEDGRMIEIEYRIMDEGSRQQ